MNRSGALVTVGLVSVGLIIMSMLNVGYWLSAPRNPPTQGDLIVVLGGGGMERVQKAFQLYQEGHAKRILINGVDRGRGDKREHYQHWRSRFLLDRGVPYQALLFDDRSANSYEEANNTTMLMKSYQWRTALVISDPPHLRRLAMVWGPACARLGLEYRLIATEPPTWDAANWWRDKVWAKFVGMEMLKLAYYAMAY